MGRPAQAILSKATIGDVANKDKGVLGRLMHSKKLFRGFWVTPTFFVVHKPGPCGMPALWGIKNLRQKIVSGETWIW
jgi:hypothetical protein